MSASSMSCAASLFAGVALLASGCAGTEVRARPQAPAQSVDAASDTRPDAAADESSEASAASSAARPSSPRACIEDGAREAVRCASRETATPAMREAYEQIASVMWGTASARPRRGEPSTHLDPLAIDGALAYLCAIAPSARAAPGLSWLEATYRRGSIYRRIEAFDRAAVVFREVAMSDPAIPDPEGLRNFASDLYLDSLNLLANARDRDGESCVAIMAADLPALRTMRCRVRNEDCERLIGIGCLIQRHQAERMAEAGQHAESARAFRALANDRDAQTAEHVCRLDEVLYNAAHEFDAADMHGEARQARETLVRTYARRGSPLAQRAQEELRSSVSPH